MYILDIGDIHYLYLCRGIHQVKMFSQFANNGCHAKMCLDVNAEMAVFNNVQHLLSPFQMLLERTFGVTRLHEVDENLTELPELDNPESERLRTFVNWLNSTKPYQAPIKVIRYELFILSAKARVGQARVAGISLPHF